MLKDYYKVRIVNAQLLKLQSFDLVALRSKDKIRIGWIAIVSTRLKVHNQLNCVDKRLYDHYLILCLQNVQKEQLYLSCDMKELVHWNIVLWLQ